MSTATIDLTDVNAFVEQRHYDMLASLRENDPVHWNPTDSGGFWALTIYEDVSSAYLDHTHLSSAGGPMLGTSFQSASADSAANRMLVASDPPKHRMLRQVLRKVFGPDYVRKVSKQVQVLVDESVDRALQDGGCDFSADIAPQLPAGALMAMVGISHSEALQVINMTRRMIGFRDPTLADLEDDEALRLAVIQSEIFEFFADLLRERRRSPGEDLVSVLSSATINGRPLSDEEILYNCMNVAVGGNETSSYTAVAGTLALIENPDQYQRLWNDPDVLETGIDEMLRWGSTNAYVLRVAVQDVEYGGKLIKAGDAVTLWNVSANSDENQFVDPGRFLVDRSPNKHITYGVGIHRCIGSVVAAAELPILFRTLIDRDVNIWLDGDVKRLRSNFIQGITELPVRMSVGR